MSSFHPSVAFVIPTLNSRRYLERCLESVRRQNYPQEAIEILIVDGGSTDETRSIAESFGAKILENPGRTGEAGKAVGARAAAAELLAFIDSDNELVGSDWLDRMTAPLADPAVCASESLYWDVSAEGLSYVDRYCALSGVNDPLCLFLGNYGRYSHLTGRWTDLHVRSAPKNGYEEVTLVPNEPIPTMGANGFLIRRELVLATLRGDLLFDIDLVYDLAQLGSARIARVPTAITHYFASGIRDFIRKTRRRTHDFFYYRDAGARTYPWEHFGVFGVAKFSIYSLLVVPLVLQALRGFRRRPDPAWLFHVPACLITFWIYSVEAVRARLGGRRPYDRSAWSQ